MPMQLAATDSTSSDYFEPEDPDFIDALQDTILPGDIPDPQLPTQEQADRESEWAQLAAGQPSLKRSHSVMAEEDSDVPQDMIPENLGVTDEDPTGDTYGASRFGEFGDYMRRKRAKLQIQNAQMSENNNDNASGETESRIFQGIAVYIDGWTEPSVQDLRKLIIQHGGIYHAYLDKKALVTHIVTCSLTPAKIQDFKHMKVVRPEWLVESAQAGTLLPWNDFIFRPGDRAGDIQGTKTAQKSLLDGFMSQARSRSSTNHPSDDPPARELIKSTSAAGASTTSLEANDVSQTPSRPEASGAQQSALDLLSSSKKPSRIDPLYTTDPSTREEAARVPGYASHKTNSMAERVMANPEWRSAHTSVAPDFIEGYYKNSRLHHLATWKAELKNLVSEAQDRAERAATDKTPGKDSVMTKVGAEGSDNKPASGSGSTGPVSMKGAELIMKSPSKGKGKQKAEPEEKVIMHCDFDSFFVSAGLVDRPQLRGKPVVVCHSQGTQGGGSSTSEIASSSYEARKFGIKNGMSLQQARKLCPTVMTMPYEFERYKQFSLQFYTILMTHADDVQAISVDEALIDVTNCVALLASERPSTPDPAKEFAETIRSEVKKATGCEVSIGIASNIMLARLATRRAKPAGSYHLLPDDVPEFLAPLEISDLWGFGWSTSKKAEEKLGVTTLGELAKKSKATLCEALGKGTGETLYKAIRGIDERKLESDKPRKSVSCEINYGIRFENNDQAETFVYQLAEEVARRLDDIGMRGHSLTLKIMKRDPDSPIEPPKFLGHGICDHFNKQIPLITTGGRATSDDKVIGEHAWKLLKSFNFDPKDLRGIGIQVQKLESNIAPPNVEPGQGKLPFKPLESSPSNRQNKSSSQKSLRGSPARAAEWQVVVQPPSDDVIVAMDAEGSLRPQNHELPSFSQVDMEVFDALPDDLRKELEAEYKRKSHSPASIPAAGSSRLSEPKDLFAKSKITVKGTSVKRITQQLAPKNRSIVSPKKHSIFSRRAGVSISEEELRELDIDPEVFALLPEDMHREQLALARQAKKSGGLSALVVESNREYRQIKASQRISRSPSVQYRKKPPPKANHPEEAGIKRPGGRKGELLYFTDTEDIQNVIQSWVETYRQHTPMQKDVDKFAKFLVQSVDSKLSTDTGTEKAIAVLKWWLVLLRRYWGMWEHVGDNGEGSGAETVGRAWWMAFRRVKEQVDVVARRKFGGCLSLR